MEIAYGGWERRIIINRLGKAVIINARRLAEINKNSSATRSRNKTTRNNKKDITGTVNNKIKMMMPKRLYSA